MFARAARAGHRTDAMLAAAHHGLAYLRDVLWDEEYGGFVWSLDRPQKTTYAQAFALFALAELVRAGGDHDARELAVRTLDLLEANAHDDEYGGYFELFAPDWSSAPRGDESPIDRRPPRVKLVNTHMHVLEAMAAAHRVDLDPRATTARTVELVDVFATRAVRRGYGAGLTDAWQRRLASRAPRPHGPLRPPPRGRVAAGRLRGRRRARPSTHRSRSPRPCSTTPPASAPTPIGGIWRQGPLGKPATDRQLRGVVAGRGAHGLCRHAPAHRRRPTTPTDSGPVWAFIRDLRASIR